MNVGLENIVEAVLELGNLLPILKTLFFRWCSSPARSSVQPFAYTMWLFIKITNDVLDNICMSCLNLLINVTTLKLPFSIGTEGSFKVQKYSRHQERLVLM
jgi:hypothetical protein